MNLRFSVNLFVVALVIISCTPHTVAQMGKGGMGQGMGYGPGSWSAADMMQQGQKLRHGAGMQGMGFMHSNADMFGHYTTFTVDESTGAITHYGIAGNAIFDSIAVDDFKYGETQVMGAMTGLVDTAGKTSIQAHDNPAGVINILSSDAHRVHFDLADSVTAIQEDDMVRIESSDVVVYIVYRAPAGSFEVDVSNETVTIDAPENSSIAVRALPVNMPGLAQVNRLMVQEMAKNRVGAEVCFAENNSVDIVHYARHLRIQEELMTNKRIRLRLDATDPAGQILSVNLDNSSLQLQERERLRIYYDNVPLQCGDDPEMFFNALHTACLISQQSRTRAQIMIHVPEFSEHLIDIVVEEEAAEAETPVSRVPGPGAVIALSGLLLAVFLIKRAKS